MQSPSSLDFTAIGSASCGARLWKGPRTRHVSLMVKAKIRLIHEGPAQLVAPEDLISKDLHYLGSPGRSVERASETAPYLTRCDVTLRGHACAPPGQSTAMSTVRLAIFRGQPLLDKKVFVVGDRDPATPDQPKPFQRMPVDYEHAFGGRSHKDNPVGKGDKPGQLPNVIDPVDATRPAGFAPLSRFWGARTRELGAVSRGPVDADEPQIAEGFDWRYFQAAPADQRIGYLVGDEWIVIDGMHPALPRLSSQLPSMRGAALMYDFTGGAYGPARPIQLEADTLAIDADSQTAIVIWRGSFVLEPAMDLAQLKIFGSVQIGGAPIPWPNPRALEPPASARAAAPATAAPALTDETYVLTPSQDFRAAQAKADPFGPPGSRPMVAPVGPSAERAPSSESFGRTLTVSPDQRGQTKAPALPFAGAAPVKITAVDESPLEGTMAVSPASVSAAHPAPSIPFAKPPPKAAPQSLDETFKLTPHQAEEAAKAEAVPFVAGDPDAPPPIVQSATRFLPTEESSDLGSTVSWRPEMMALLKQDIAPFPIARPRTKEAKQAGAKGAAGPGGVPRRESPQVPILHGPTLTATTTPWQVQPPQDSLTVIVKATFDLVAGGKATLRDEPDPLSGDLHVDDDPEKGLLYASDFAVMKPKADVVLRGHAFAANGSATHARVAFKLGAGSAPRGFDRAIFVVGDRTWQNASTAPIPGNPAPFAELPITYERAFGGPRFASNPIGIGHGTAPLPNLEDPEHLMKSPADAPSPACFGPVPALWKQRWSRLGTYDAAWFASRWPYFPADFDPHHFQHAPLPQQVEPLRGDESFEIAGMHREIPVLRGSLPGVRMRAFGLMTDKAGGEFFEIDLRADTAAFDMDELKLNLIWRGIVEVSDDEAPEIETLFIHMDELDAAPVSLDEAKKLMIATANPPEQEDEEPPPQDVPFVRPSAQELARMRESVRVDLASGAAFDDRDLAGAELIEHDFTGRSLARVNLKEAVVRGSCFAGADLSGAVLAGVDLTDCDLTAANLEGADLVGAKLTRAKLSGANLSGADLSEVFADGASFEKATGEAAQFAGGSFVDARFGGASLPSADFTGAKLDRAIFDDAVLTEVRLFYAKAERARFDRARMEEARCDDASLVESSFAGVRAAGSVWEKATLTSSSFASADLAGASFSRAQCERAIFLSVEAPEANFARANLASAQLVKANLLAADFERADLTSADLRGANLHGAETWKAKLGGAKLDLAIVTQSKLGPARS